MSRRRPVVLHVVHGLGSGVERVVLDHVAATPELEHHVLHSTDPACHGTAWAGSAGFTSVREVDGSPRRFAREVRRVRRELGPDLVHAHSSVAGAVTRAVLPGTPVVYTPHCFAFERRDVGVAARAAFWLVEAALGRRTSALAACSPREADLGRRLVPAARVHLVPNTAAAQASATTHGPVPRPARPGGERRVVAMGRVAAQKAPEAFAALAEDLRAAPDGSGGRDEAVRLTWVGAGSEEQTAVLRAAGVEVTGWLEHAEAAERLAGADVYVHTALWEATPLTILEAARLGVPVLARDTAPIRALGLAGTWTSRAELATAVRDVLGDDATAGRLRADGRRLLEEHSPHRQREALRACYADVLADAPWDRHDPVTHPPEPVRPDLEVSA